MRKVLFFAVALVAILASRESASAADLGKPKDLTFEDLLKAKAPSAQSTTCYVETSAAGTFLRDTRQAQAGLGGGCDMKLYNMIVGAGARADIADWRNTGSIFLKAGVAINGSNTLYLFGEGRIPDIKAEKTGQFLIGLGAEVKLDIISPSLKAFTEGGIVAAKWGSGAGNDDLVTRLGFRYEIPVK